MLEYLKEQRPDIYHELIIENCYDVSEEKVKGKIVFDLGANRGFFALLCNELGAKEIICIEAQKDMCEGLLKENTKHLSNVKILHNAVTDRTGDIVTLSNDDHGSSIYVNKEIKGVGAEVKTISLEDLVKDYSENDMVLKLDIEGSEYDVLMKADKKLLRRFEIIGVEIHGNIHPEYKDKGTDVLENKLVESGFQQTKVLEMCHIYTNEDGTKKYVPMGFRTIAYKRLEEIKGSYILIAPFAQKMRNNKENPKNYPYWKELINMFENQHIIQLGIAGEKQLVKDFRTNLPLDEIKKLIIGCDFFISVDSFLQHMAYHVNKRGIVLWGPSDPNIFGYPYNLNIIKDRKFLKPLPFDIWERTEFDSSIFNSAKEVYEIITKNFNLG
jgi:FkbM family methyltransferase